MKTPLPNTSAAKKFAEFMASPKGRDWARAGIAGTAVILCHEDEILSDVITRAKLYDPPVTVAVEHGPKIMSFFTVQITSGNEVSDKGTVDPGVTMGMLVAYMQECNGHFSFRMSAWDPALEAKQLESV